ncbi:heavy-metal-associated domain-containing protein [archaeon]|jgi:copper chaperone CopZ|nr:heavy-metal-associated domain-containing protein [archaeon]MBT3730977.1 heavy-metal-associated domain-containing protein [archaeon]MBT4669785.1 heavy-metal-associated domain-containing protein [archaeon]MBT5029936.1 heavy-metal-associated domain-containing protein [archaeon]MBT5288507.1 heavy-metal-associated domain-containing protein [archaeon]
MKTEKFKVGGMHCKSCEMLIKDSLEELGVKDISFEKEIITITFDETKISLEDIKKVIGKEGYKAE